MYDEFFTKAHELMEQGIPFATATVVRAEKPTSGKTGDKAIITADGTMHGWIGGSCAQPTVIKEALKALADGEHRFIRLTPNPEQQAPRDGLIDLPMTCFSGGTLEIYIEPQYFRPRLLIVGSLPVAQALAQLGKVMNYHVVAVDPDGHSIPHADLVISQLDKAADYIRPDTYVIVATHGNYDEIALEKVVKAKPTYVGLVASSKRFQEVLNYLQLQGLTEEELQPLKAPAGLDIQARRGDEIALSIMAEIVQRRRNRHEILDLATFQPQAQQIIPLMEIHSHHHHHHTEASTVAIDPVCGMEVEIATAKYTYEHNGVMYYFCAAGCKTRFVQDPIAYLQKGPPVGYAIDPVCNMEVEIATAQHMSEYNGEIYYFCAKGCQTTFEKNPQAYIHAIET